MPQHSLCSQCDCPRDYCQEDTCVCQVLQLCICPTPKTPKLSLEEEEPGETSIPTPTLSQCLKESSDSMPKRCSSPTLTAQYENKGFSRLSTSEIESRLVLQSMKPTPTDHPISTSTSPFHPNWISPIHAASTSSRITQWRAKLLQQLSNDITLTSSESMVLRTLSSCMNTFAKMATHLLSSEAKWTSTDSARIFASATETASHGLLTASRQRSSHLLTPFLDQTELVTPILHQQGRNETSGSTDQPMPARPSGLKRRSTAFRTTKSETRVIPSTTTPDNKSSSTTTSNQQPRISSFSGTLVPTPGLSQVLHVTTNGTFLEELPSGRSSASTRISQPLSLRKKKQ